MSDFYKRLDEKTMMGPGIRKLLQERPDDLHDYQGCASDTAKLPDAAPSVQNRNKPWLEDYVIPSGSQRCQHAYHLGAKDRTPTQCKLWSSHTSDWHWAIGGAIEWVTGGQGDMILPSPSPIAEPAKALQIDAIFDKWRGTFSSPRMDDNYAAPQPVIPDAKVEKETICGVCDGNGRFDSGLAEESGASIFVKCGYCHGTGQDMEITDADKKRTDKRLQSQETFVIQSLLDQIHCLERTLAESKPLPSEPAEGATYLSICNEFDVYKREVHSRGIGGKDRDTWLTEQLVIARNAAKAEKVEESWPRESVTDEQLADEAWNVKAKEYQRDIATELQAYRELKKRSVRGTK